MKLKRALLIPALCCLLTACPPPFDTGMGQAMRLIRNMRLEAHIGQFGVDDRTPLDADAVFMPFRDGTDIERTAGVIVSQNGDQCSLWYVWGTQEGTRTVFTGLSKTALMSSNATSAIPGYPEFLTYPMVSGTKFLSMIFAPLQSLALVVTAGTTDGVPTVLSVDPFPQINYLPAAFTGPHPNAAVLGGHFISAGTGTEDLVHFLVSGDQTGASGYWEFESQLTSSALNVFAEMTAAVSLPFLVDLPYGQHCMYFHDAAAQKSYASALIGGAWQCWTWTTGPVGAPVLLPGVTRRVDALLSTGELFSVQDGTGTVYGPDGTVKTSFPLGCLRFLNETDVSGAKAALFSLMIREKETVDFYLYSMPTSGLAGLD